MKAKITEHVVYDVEIDGHLHIGFKLVDQWEGMIKLRKGDLIVILNGIEPFENFLQNVVRKSVPTESEIIKMSPSLMPSKQG